MYFLTLYIEKEIVFYDLEFKLKGSTVKMESTIIGKKVILRRRTKEDAVFYAYWYNQPKIMFQCGFIELTTLEAEQNFADTDDSDWYTITDFSGKIIGETGLLRMWPAWHCTDLSIIIPDPIDQGKGYGTEAIDLMLRLAFEKYRMNRVAIGVVAKNIDALDFYKKIGFKIEGKQEEGYFYDNEYSDFIMMRLLIKEWINQNNSK